MSLVRRGGSPLNNKDGEIIGLELTTTYPFGDGKPSEYGEALYAVLTVETEGAEKPTIKPLKIGAAENYEADGLVVTGPGGFHENSQMGKFMADVIGVCEVPESTFTEDDGATVDLTPLLNARLRFVMRPDPELQAKFGQKQITTKTGQKKAVDREYLGVSKVYSLGGDAPVVAPVKTVTRAAGKPNGKAVTEAVTAETTTRDAVLAILKETPGHKIQVSKLATRVALKLGKGNAFGDEAQELLDGTDWIRTLPGVTFDAAKGELRA